MHIEQPQNYIWGWGLIEFWASAPASLGADL